MNIQNVNEKIIIVPTRIEDVSKLKSIEEDVIIVDFIDENPHCAVLGCLWDLEQNHNKTIIYLHRGGFIEGMLQYRKQINILN